MQPALGAPMGAAVQGMSDNSGMPALHAQLMDVGSAVLGRGGAGLLLRRLAPRCRMGCALAVHALPAWSSPVLWEGEASTCLEGGRSRGKQHLRGRVCWQAHAVRALRVRMA